MAEPLVVNGRSYPLWSQFVQRQDEWKGGVLQDFGDPMDRAMGLVDANGVKTKIVGICLEPNGKEGAFFSVKGKDFTCGFDCKTGGVGAGEEGWITFFSYGGHKWRIKPRKAKTLDKTLRSLDL